MSIPSTIRRRPRPADRRTKFTRAAVAHGRCWAFGTVGYQHAEQAAAAAQLRLWQYAATNRPQPRLTVTRCTKCGMHHIRTITD